jgi:membrane protein YqaA with SNARE-associated domain
VNGEILLIAASFGFGIASALIPIINAEAYVLGVCAAAKPGPATLAMLALVVGTVVGKLVLFLGARHRDKLGRLLRKGHRTAVDNAEAGLARGLAAEIAAAEASLEKTGQVVLVHQGDRGGDPDGLEPERSISAPAGQRRFPWLPATPRWFTATRRAIVAWGDRALGLLDKPWQAAGVLMASSTLGVPPLAVTTIAAGLRTTSLPLFVLCVVVGRGARFAIIAVPTLLARN